MGLEFGALKAQFTGTLSWVKARSAPPDIAPHKAGEGGVAMNLEQTGRLPQSLRALALRRRSCQPDSNAGRRESAG